MAATVQIIEKTGAGGTPTDKTKRDDFGVVGLDGHADGARPERIRSARGKFNPAAQVSFPAAGSG